ncbi:MAG: hypothetical protein PUG14_01755 [Acholeplasmatales bacterium]|nr:hypothetical protein [Acholeplasmatales bacterium]MDD7394779.1 hypothetical protein [Acholeplasmatales bacterium]
MKKPYFTRKNLIVLSLAFFYSFLLLFVGLCLDGSHLLIGKKNPIALVAEKINFEPIRCGVTGYVSLILVAIYISVFVALFLYEKRYAVLNNKKPYSLKMILSYLASLVACFILSFGVGMLICGKNGIKTMYQFTGQSLLITTCIYILAFAFIGGILMFIVNFTQVDRPFRAFEDKNYPVLDDDDLVKNDVSSNFDAVPSSKVSGTVSGEVGIGQPAATDNNNSSVIRQTEELDDREKVFPALSMMDEEYEGYAVENVVSDNLTLNEIATRFRNYLAKEEKLYFDIDTIRFFVSGFAASHFMILEGLSGTGKSSLPRYFAKFINANLLFVPVQATWRDKTNLIGYFNDFSKAYSETEFLTSLYHANYNPDMIHMFVLDEMNISRVEYYFADFLSVLEYPEEEWKIKIMQLPYNFIPPAKLDDGVIQIPNNVYFVGTANKDDSTFTITDKVYDRAITIDFDNRNDAFNVNGDASTINLSRSALAKLYQEAKNNKSYQMTDNDYQKFQTISDYIYDQFDITFGNRILNQISELVPVFVSCGGTKEEALDFLLSRKVISKIEGRFEEYVKNALRELLNLIHKTYGKDVLKRSEKTIQNLMRRL